MASLTNLLIANSYDGLLTTTTNQPLSASLVNIADGLGNASALNLSTNQINVSGTLTVNSNPVVLSSQTASMSVANTVSASYALSSSNAVSASFARSASNALSGSYAISSSFAISASFAPNPISSSYALSASYAVSASNTPNSITASYALTASFWGGGSTYVPYTGATSNVSLGNFDLSADDVTLTSDLASLTRDLGSGYGSLRLKRSANGYIIPTTLSVDRTYTLPNQSGTIAVLTNDVLTLTPQHPLPAASANPYSFAVSASSPAKPFFSDGANWNPLY